MVIMMMGGGGHDDGWWWSWSSWVVVVVVVVCGGRGRGLGFVVVLVFGRRGRERGEGSLAGYNGVHGGWGRHACLAGWLGGRWLGVWHAHTKVRLASLVLLPHSTPV